MKNVIQKVFIAGAACFAVMLISTSASAGTITQLKYLQTLAQLTGDAGQFNAGALPVDYVQWAQTRGIQPTGGWKTTAKLSSDVLAESLVQLYGLNPRKYGGDSYRILEREGIVIDRTAAVSGEYLAGLLDNPVVALKAFQVAGAGTSPHKPGNGHGFGFGWYRHNGLPQPPDNPGPPNGNGNPHLPGNGNGHGNGHNDR